MGSIDRESFVFNRLPGVVVGNIHNVKVHAPTSVDTGA